MTVFLIKLSNIQKCSAWGMRNEFSLADILAVGFIYEVIPTQFCMISIASCYWGGGGGGFSGVLMI